MALVASAGHRPQRTMAPRSFKVLSWLIESNSTFISKATISLNRWIYINLVGFPRNQSTRYYTSAMLRKHSTNYDAVMQQLRDINHVPTFAAWSKSERHIDEELALNISRLSGAGPRIVFKGGGHNIQKTRASALASEVWSWIDDVMMQGKQLGPSALPRTSSYFEYPTNPKDSFQPFGPSRL